MSKRLFELADLFLRFVPGDSIAFLQAASEIFAAAVCALQVFYFGGAIWIFVRSYVHFGEIASPKSVFAATAYATSFVFLTFSLLSAPIFGLAAYNGDPALFHELGPLNASNNFKYELVLYYFYVRAIAFTTGIMLHWGIVFTILIGYALALIATVV